MKTRRQRPEDNAEASTEGESGNGTEKSNAAEGVVAARADRSAARAHEQIAVSEPRAATALTAMIGLNAQGDHNKGTCQSITREICGQNGGH